MPRKFQKVASQPPIDPAALAEVAAVAAQDEEISAFAKRFSGNIQRVGVLKYSDTKDKYVHMGSVSIDVINEDFIQQRWKGGTYKLNFHNDEGMLVTQRTGIEIADPVDDPKAAANVNKEPGQALQTIDPIQLLREQLARAHEEKLEMIRNQKPAPAFDFSGIIPLLSLLKPNTEALGMKDVFEVFTKGMEMAREKESSGGGSEWADVAKSLLVPMAGKLLNGGGGAPSVVHAPAPPDDEESPDDYFFNQILDFVEPAIAGNSDPALMSRLVMLKAKADPGQLEMLATFLEQPFAQVLAELAAIEPAIAEEKAATWLQSFYDKLKDEIHKLDTAPPAGRPGGHPANAGNNGHAGATQPARAGNP